MGWYLLGALVMALLRVLFGNVPEIEELKCEYHHCDTQLKALLRKHTAVPGSFDK